MCRHCMLYQNVTRLLLSLMWLIEYLVYWWLGCFCYSSVDIGINNNVWNICIHMTRALVAIFCCFICLFIFIFHTMICVVRLLFDQPADNQPTGVTMLWWWSTGFFSFTCFSLLVPKSWKPIRLPKFSTRISIDDLTSMDHRVGYFCAYSLYTSDTPTLSQLSYIKPVLYVNCFSAVQSGRQNPCEVCARLFLSPETEEANQHSDGMPQHQHGKRTKNTNLSSTPEPRPTSSLINWHVNNVDCWWSSNRPTDATSQNSTSSHPVPTRECFMFVA